MQTLIIFCNAWDALFKTKVIKIDTMKEENHNDLGNQDVDKAVTVTILKRSNDYTPEL